MCHILHHVCTTHYKSPKVWMPKKSQGYHVHIIIFLCHFCFQKKYGCLLEQLGLIIFCYIIIIYSSSLLQLISLYPGLFIFASFITLIMLRCSCCMVRGLPWTSWINFWGQWLSHLKKFNIRDFNIRDFWLRQQETYGLTLDTWRFGCSSVVLVETKGERDRRLASNKR